MGGDYYETFSSRAMALEEPLDPLFADMAIRVQLSQTAHDKAVQRYSAIAERLDGEDSAAVTKGHVMTLAFRCGSGNTGKVQRPSHTEEQIMAKSSGGKGGGGRQGGKSGGGRSGQGGGLPSKTSNPSGGGRTNNPPGGGRKS